MKQRVFSSDNTFHFFNTLFAIFVLLITFYPLYWMLIASFSDPSAINTGNVILFPRGFTIAGYKTIFQYDRLWLGYWNTIVYTVLGTGLSLMMTLSGGYALSRKDLIGRNAIMIFLTFTMFFGGGLVPSYLLVRNLGMENTIFAMFVPSAISVYNIIVAKTFFQSLPIELYEAAELDGCTNTQYFFRIAVKLSTPLIAVMVLFYAVGMWNSYMPALIYLRDRSLHPLQMVLRDILINNETKSVFQTPNSLTEQLEQQKFQELVKYTMIIVSSVPILVLYPFLQKYFVKGVMIGSIKG